MISIRLGYNLVFVWFLTVGVKNEEKNAYKAKKYKREQNDEMNYKLDFLVGKKIKSISGEESSKPC